MPRIQFPNVPNDPGVPQLLRKLPAAPPTIVATISGIAALGRAFVSDTHWGIFKHVEPTASTDSPTTAPDGTPLLAPVVVEGGKRLSVVTPDSFLDFDYTQETSVTTAPTQRGEFADYNRVASAFEIKFRMAKGGSVLDRRLFLGQIAALDTVQLYDIDTPEKTYVKCNFVRAEISRRGEKGAYWLSMVDVTFRQIREVIPTYSKTVISTPASASATQQQNNGTQQGVATTATLPVSVTR